MAFWSSSSFSWSCVRLLSGLRKVLRLTGHPSRKKILPVYSPFAHLETSKPSLPLAIFICVPCWMELIHLSRKDCHFQIQPNVTVDTDFDTDTDTDTDSPAVHCESRREVLLDSVSFEFQRNKYSYMRWCWLVFSQRWLFDIYFVILYFLFKFMYASESVSGTSEWWWSNIKGGLSDFIINWNIKT